MDRVKLPPYEIKPILKANAAEAVDWTYSFYDISAFHKRGWMGQGEKFAILDTGFNSTHPDLRENVAHVEDMRGYKDPIDRNYHSTWIHGRGSAAHNGFGVKGIAPAAKAYIFKVLDDDGSGSPQHIIDGLYKAHKMGCRWFNLSVGMPMDWKPMKKACDTIAAAGGLIFAAAGNDGTEENIDYPGAYDSTICIGSHDKFGNRSNFSDFGNEMDLFSAGEDVLSTYGPKDYGYLSGTSMATPTDMFKLMCAAAHWEAATGKQLTIYNINQLVSFLL